jgi:hypothetical protein
VGLADVGKPVLIERCHDDVSRNVAARLGPGMKIKRQRHRRAAGPEDQKLSACAAPVSLVDNRLRCPADRDRILGMAAKAATALRNATDFAKRFGVGIEFVEEVARCLEKVHLVRRDESAERERIFLDETHGFPVSRGVFIGNKIDAFDNRV